MTRQEVIIGNASLLLGDCIEVMAKMPDNSIAAIVCDPPYLLNFMGKAFDRQHKALPGANEGQKMQAWHARWVAEAFRILKPGGFLAAFGGDRTHHRLLAAMEDEGFELKQNLYFCFGSGFPKATDASKMLDKKAGAKRTEVIGTRHRNVKPYNDENGWNKNNTTGDYQYTAPATEAAKKWAGSKTALKPAVEPICVGRKPMVGTLADNLLAWGCGALNIDGCRVDFDKGTEPRKKWEEPSGKKIYDGSTWENRIPIRSVGKNKTIGESYLQGRYPANLLHDGSQEVVGLFPVTTSGKEAATLVDINDSSMYNDSIVQPMDELSCCEIACIAEMSLTPGHLQSKKETENIAPNNADGILCESKGKKTHGGKKIHQGAGKDAGVNQEAEEYTISLKADGFGKWSVVKYQKDLKSIMQTMTPTTMNCQTCGASLQLSIIPTTSDYEKTILIRRAETSCESVKNARNTSPFPCLLNEKQEHITDIANPAQSNMLENGSAAKLNNSAARFFQSCPYDAGDFDPLFYSGKASRRDRTEGATKNNHVSVKSTSLMRWLVRLFVPPGETVLDPFMGSGSTLKAALLENKTCIGIEIDPEYFAIAVERIKHVSPDSFTLESPT